MTKHTVIRTIYLYLFSLVGLVLIIIGCVNFLDMGLKAWVFTAAEQQEKYDYNRPVEPYCMEEKMRSAKSAETFTLTEQEYEQMTYMLIDYDNWKNSQEDVDYLSSSRARRASINLSLILVGIPLYLYHWFIIRREKKLLEK
jgi:hypothetical protein